MIQITVEEGASVSVADIPSALGPALRSAIEELRNELGERAAGAHKYDKEDAITRAITAVGTLAATINAVIPEGDPAYE
jgi:hypothetical protein